MLGLRASDGWDAVRPAYRRLIRELHPDRAGTASTRRAARINEAYAVLIRAKRAEATDPERGQAAGAGASPGPRQQSPPRSSRPVDERVDEPVSTGTQVDGSEILFLDMPLEEALGRLLAAGDTIGGISYVDRSCAIFEVIVRHDGETCSLLVTLQGRGRGTEALFVLEALERVASPSPTPVVRKLVSALRNRTS